MNNNVLAIALFLLTVWMGVETGRYLESKELPETIEIKLSNYDLGLLNNGNEIIVVLPLNNSSIDLEIKRESSVKNFQRPNVPSPPMGDTLFFQNDKIPPK